MTIEVEPLQSALGARVHGVDLAAPVAPATCDAIHAAWMEHLVLVFPGQQLTDQQLVDFAGNFGELEVFHQKIIKSQRVPQIFRVANTDEDGKLLPPGNLTVRQLSSAQLWHTDSSYRPVPSMGSLLYGIEVTREGGETLFSNMYAVLDALPPALAARIEGRRARHDFGYLRILRELPPVSADEAAAMPPVWQPLVRRHPVTGRRSLYISTIYNDEVEGMSPQEGKALIAELAGFAGRDEFVYRHRWSAGDVLMWDNRCTVHQVTRYDPAERRVLHRTTIVGDGPVIAG
jgi:alpha-ketoglutarate-dependent taurine dioxygenase